MSQRHDRVRRARSGFALLRLGFALASLGFGAEALAAIAFKQVNSNDPASSASIAVPFTAAQTAGDLNVVVVSFNDSTTHVSSVTDTSGNTYTLAVGPTLSTGNATQSIYYAKAIAAASANANTVTVTLTASASYPDIRIAEYSGVDTTAPLNGTAAASGTGVNLDSGPLTTTNANDLLFASSYVAHDTTGPGTSFTQRLITQDASIVEDRIVTTTGTYDGTAPQDSSGWWVMQMVAFKAASGGADNQGPSVPTGLTATAASNTQVNLSWSPSTDNVGVTNYVLQRCQGTACSTFGTIGSPVTTSFADTGLTASTVYRYQVAAQDAVPNTSAYSTIASATTLSGGPPLAFKQVNSNDPDSASSVAVTYTAAQTAADLNIVVVSFNDSTSHVGTVTDTKGNTYALAVGPTLSSGNATQSIYTAKNIAAAAANANTVTVTFNATVAYPDVRIVEYSGVNTTAPVDTTAGAAGNGTNMDSGALTTTNANDLLFASSYVAHTTTGPGTGFTSRLITNDASIVEDEFVSTTGTYHATAPQDSSGWWILQIVALKGSSGSGDNQAPTAPTNLTPTVVSSSQINLSWTASTDNVGVTGYVVQRCTGTACSTFSPIGTPSGTTFSDTGLTAATTYRYQVVANDAAGNPSLPSNTVNATTSAAGDGTPPSPPTGLTPTVISSSQINLSWTASTDNVGVTGYQVQRCTGAACSNFSSAGTPTGTTFSDTGLTAATTYRYQVIAHDAAGNPSLPSNIVSATTSAAGDTQAPTAPSNLTPIPGGTVVNLTWTASTDNVGVTGYRVERCLGGAGCSMFSLAGSPTTTSFSDTGLTPGTAYTYRVWATDAAGNPSLYSNVVSTATTSALTAPTGLTPVAASSVEVDLAWTASTGGAGSISYVIESCTGANCSNFTQPLGGTSTSTHYYSLALMAGTPYSYRVWAKDSTGDSSGYSNVVSLTTVASTTVNAADCGN